MGEKGKNNNSKGEELHHKEDNKDWIVIYKRKEFGLKKGNKKQIERKRERNREIK